jgi:hypothetical protein
MVVRDLASPRTLVSANSIISDISGRFQLHFSTTRWRRDGPAIAAAASQVQLIDDVTVNNGLHHRLIQAQQQIFPAPAFFSREASKHAGRHRGGGGTITEEVYGSVSVRCDVGLMLARNLWFE